jgi:serine/threonine protein kinase/tetratricopeptide (TPR) repeat protein
MRDQKANSAPTNLARDKEAKVALTPERWRLMKELFGAALQREPAEQNAFLREACGSDEPLRAEIEALLADAADNDAVVPASQNLQNESPHLEDQMVGHRLGPYEIVKPIGQGGMASVYLAVRADEQYRKCVAIKLVSAGRETTHIVRRFRHERQTLAGLDHPNIVKLLDGGITQEGLPYLVMDYVEGLPLDEYCDRYELCLNERLQLFRSVCMAVQYAHEKLVIHRDLKPSNILVTRDGMAKLLDFGIAKVLNSELSGEMSLTRTADRQLTPGYASPEQVRGEATTCATDVYSLGVVLYEVLTGHRPYRFQRLTPAEMERVICERQPEKPSTVVGRVEKPTLDQGEATITPEDVSRKRKSEPEKLRRQLRGDLDNIVLTALHKEPERRYASVKDFADDIGRHLEHRPVQARTNTLAYRSSKFVKRHKREIATAVIALVLLSGIVTIGIAGLFYMRRSHQPTERNSIVVADFENRTGDSDFDYTLGQALVVELEQSPFLNVLSHEKVNAIWKLMGRSPNERVTGELARDLCQRAGFRVLLAGSIASLGSQYIISLDGAKCSTGDSVLREQVTARRPEDVLKALDKAADNIRSTLGESLNSIEKFNKPLEEATTPSLEALKAYTLGRKMHSEKGDIEAIPFLKRAVELDPNFAMAYATLAALYSNMDEPSRAAYNAQRAYELRSKVTEHEKYRIEALYYLNAGAIEKAMESAELWAQAYPEADTPHTNLASIYSDQGRWEKSLSENQEVLRLNPNSGFQAYSNLGFNYIALGRLDDAKATVEKSAACKRGCVGLRYYLSFLENDTAEMERQLDQVMGKPGYEDGFLSTQADTEAYHGHLLKAREFSRRAVESARNADFKESAANWQANAALREAEFGNTDLARHDAIKAIALATSRDTAVLAAAALARTGDATQTKKLVSKINMDFPLNSIVQRYWLPTLRASLELSLGNSARATTLLETAAPYELGGEGYLYAIYVRGRAHLLSRQGRKASAEFQKIVDHPGIVLNFPTAALAHLGLARAYVLTGEIVKARTKYEEFFALWKDADPEIPMLRQAKREYAKLQGRPIAGNGLQK